MKKNTFFLSLVVFLACGILRAQTPIPLPNRSFEQWTQHQGYGVQVVFLNVPVYEAYATPSGWDYLSYPVNETFSMMGMSLNINTSIPVIKATAETGQVPDSSTAVKLQTLMISDIVSSTVLSLASGSIDPTLTQTVIPSILATGEVNIDAFIPLVSDLLSGSDIITMLPTLLAMDVNDFVTGGLPLNGLKPGIMTGNYKYHSAIGGDNGAVIMLGTRYNAAAHKREIVGLGLNMALTDTSEYTPFEVEYLPLNEFLPGLQGGTPDSLIVAILSSASNNMQQGSYLCVDNLNLWSAPDTCATVNNLRIENIIYDDFPQMVLMWNGSSQPDHWEVEYGPQGFEHGTGTVVETEYPYFEIFPLEQSNVLSPNTQYDFYVRSVCEDDIYGEWDSIHYRTFCAKVDSVTVNDSEDDLYITADSLIGGYSISWVDNTGTERWGVYYGIYNPRFPDNWGTYVVVDTPYFEFPPRLPNTTYSVEISVRCGEDNYGDIVWVNFHTIGLPEPPEPPEPEGIELANTNIEISVVPNPAHGQCVVNVSDNRPAELKLFGLDGRLLQTISTNGTPIMLQLPSQGIFLLQATTASGVATRKIVNK